MKLVRTLGTVENCGCLFEFAIDLNSPEEPELSQLRYYYVVATDPSPARAFCYLSVCCCGPSLYSPECRWFVLYNRVFGPVAHDHFVRELRKTAQAAGGDYRIFTDESSAREAFETLTAGRRGGLTRRYADKKDVHFCSSQTSRDVKTAAAAHVLSESPKLRLGETEEPLSKEQHMASKKGIASAVVGSSQSADYHLQGTHQCFGAERLQYKDEVIRLQNEVHQLRQRLGEIGCGEGNMQKRHSTTTFATLEENQWVVKELMAENNSLKQRHREMRIKLEYWRAECLRLKHLFSNKAVVAGQPTMTVSQEQYKNLEERHQLLHKELDELSEEKTYLENKLRSTEEELVQRRAELKLALQALHSLGRGLDSVQHKLPLVLQNETCTLN